MPANSVGRGDLRADRTIARNVDQRAAVRPCFVGRAALGAAGVVNYAVSVPKRLPLRLAAEGPVIDHLLGKVLRIVVAIGDDDRRQAVGIGLELADLKR